MLKFDIGDRVRVTEDDADGAAVKAGDVGVVLRKIDGDHYEVRMSNGRDWFFNDDALDADFAPLSAPFEIIPPTPARPSVRVILTADQVEYLTHASGTDEDDSEVAKATYRLLRDISEALGQ